MLRIGKLSVKQLVGIGSIVGTVSIGSLVTFNQDMRMEVNQRITNLKDRVVKIRSVRTDTTFLPGETIVTPPETVEVYMVDPALNPVTEDDIDRAFRAAIQELQVEFTAIALRFETIDQAIAGIKADEKRRHQTLVNRVKELAARKIERPMLYIQLPDGVLQTVDPDTLQASEDWLKALWPWLKEGR